MYVPSLIRLTDKNKPKDNLTKQKNVLKITTLINIFSYCVPTFYLCRRHRNLKPTCLFSISFSGITPYQTAVKIKHAK